MPGDTRTPAAEPHAPSEAGSAFISYSRQESTRLAVALQTGLERFAKPWYRLRAIRVFRDDTNMAANPDLRGTIEAALGRSGWLILLASPRAAESTWVADELSWWIEHRSVARIMLVLAAGELVWDDAAGRFDAEQSSALPPVLSDAYTVQPRWIDLRWFAQDDGLGDSDARFTERIADLAAPLHGKERSDLVGENVRQHRRAVRLARAGVLGLATLLVLSLAASVIAVDQRAAANRDRDTAISQTRVSVARQLAATATNLSSSDMQKSALLAVQAYRLHPDLQTAAALYTSVASSPHLVGYLDAGSPVTATAGTPSTRFVVAGTGNGQVWRWDRTTGQRLQLPSLPYGVRRVLVSDDGSTVGAWSASDGPDTSDSPDTSNSPDSDTSTGAGYLWHNGSLTRTDNELMALSPSGLLAAMRVPSTTGNGADLALMSGGHRVSTLHAGDEARWVLMPSDQRLVIVYPGGPLESYSIPSGRRLVKGSATSGAHPITSAVDPTGSYVAVFNGSKHVEIDPVENLPDSGSPSPTGFARTESPSPVAFAISPGGGRLATAVDGRIWVGRIAHGVHAEPASPLVLPGSGTARAGTLQFLDQNVLISGAGTSVAIWNLQQTSRLGTTLHIPDYPGCNACGPGHVAVNPSGTKAVVSDEYRTSVDYVDFSHRIVASAGWQGGEASNLLDADLTWLDDNRLFAWYDSYGVAAIWRGTHAGELETSWKVPGQQRKTGDSGAIVALARSADGHVVLADSRGRVLTFDPRTHAAVLGPLLPWTDAAAVGLSVDGSSAWALSPGSSSGTRVQLAATSSGRASIDQVVDHEIDKAQLVGDQLHLWPERGPEVVLSAGHGDSLAATPLPLNLGSTFVVHQPLLLTEENGEVTIFDTGLGGSIGTFAVPVEVYAWTDLGLSASDQTLIVATTAHDSAGKATARQLTLGYQRWQEISCAMAGRDLGADEWRQLTDLEPPGDLRC